MNKQVIGSYGTLFIPPEKHTQPSLQVVIDNLYEQSIRERLEPPRQNIDKTAKAIGKLYGSGTESKAVVNVILRKSKNNFDNSQSESSFSSNAKSNKSNAKISNNHLRATETLQRYDKRNGGKYHVTDMMRSEPYTEIIQNKPSSSYFNRDTPIMWPPQAQFPTSSSHPDTYNTTLRQTSPTHTFGKKSYSTTKLLELSQSTHTAPLSPFTSDRMCSKSFEYHHNNSSSNHKNSNHYEIHQNSSYSSNSELQNTLIKCGKLHVIDHSTALKESEIIEESLNHQLKQVRNHAKWLRQSQSDNSYNYNDDHLVQSSVTFEHKNHQKPRLNNSFTHNKSSVSQLPSTINTTNNEKGIRLDLPKKKSSYSSSVSKEDKLFLKSIVSKSHGLMDESLTNGSSVKLSNSSNSNVQSNLNLENAINNYNPFRKINRSDLIISHSRTVPRSLRVLDPLAYRDEVLVRNTRTMNILIKPDIKISNYYGSLSSNGYAPSRKEVTEIMEQLTRKSIIAYSTRIVETAAMLRALRDIRHPTPGLYAIIDLHSKLIAAASINPNSWLLNRIQLQRVLSNYVPWLSADSIHRLILSYDPQNTGLIRYVRITATLICCLEPSINHLSSTFNRVRNKVKKSDGSSADDNQAEHGAGDLNYVAEAITIRFLHHLYEECGGSTKYVGRLNRNENAHQFVATEEMLSAKPVADGAAPASVTAEKISEALAAGLERVGVGIKLEDILEAFSCCVCSIDDEIKMEKEASKLIDIIIERHNDKLESKQAQGTGAGGLNGSVSTNTSNSNVSGAITMNTVMKYPLVRSIADIPNLSVEELLDGIAGQSSFFQEFVRQVKEFRKAAMPYMSIGNRSINDSLDAFSTQYHNMD
eukprot:gene9674-13024_t